MSNVGVLSTLEGASYQQFGHSILCTQVRYATLAAFFEIDHDVQRQLDPQRRSAIRHFIIDALQRNEPFYFSPFTFSARREIEEIEGGFVLKPGSKIYVLDGQHRYSAIGSAISLLQTKLETAEEEAEEEQEIAALRSYIEALKNYPVAMQIYLDITKQEERQLFTDYNTERQDAQPGLMLKYNQRDPYSVLTKNVAAQLQHKMEIDMVASRVSRNSSAVTTLITMRRCLIALFEGILTVKNGDPYYRNCKPQEVPLIAHAFFDYWLTLFPKQMHNRKKYVVGHSGIQIALAQTVHLLTRESSLSHLEAIRLLKLLKKRCTWRHEDALFAHMYDEQSKQIRTHSSTTAIKKTSLAFLTVIHEERG